MPHIERKVQEIDATGKVVGRLATHIATLLMGKHEPGMIPHIDSGDIVKVSNVDKIEFTGKSGNRRSISAAPVVRVESRPCRFQNFEK